MRKGLTIAALLLLAVGLAPACDDGDGGDEGGAAGAGAGGTGGSAGSGGSAGGGGGPCGTEAEPTLLEVIEVVPEVGATVPNLDIVQAYTVTNGPAPLGSFNFEYLADHTTGNYTAAPQIRIQADDVGYRYTFDPPIAWENVGHVEFRQTDVFEDGDGCFWKLPSPLFDYEVVTP
jgi:hypothetical protein